jgi:hypothetical protein
MLSLLSFIKMLLIAVLLPATFFFWARPGLMNDELSAFAAFGGVALATAAPVIALHFAWHYVARRRTNRREPPQ